MSKAAVDLSDRAIQFYADKDEGQTDVLTFEKQGDGTIYISMYGGGGIGPDTWDVEIDEFNTLKKDDALILAAWLTQFATTPPDSA